MAVIANVFSMNFCKNVSHNMTKNVSRPDKFPVDFMGNRIGHN